MKRSMVELAAVQVRRPDTAEGAPEATVGYQVRGAIRADVPGIVGLVHEEAKRGNLLPRAPHAIYEGLADWLVAVRRPALHARPPLRRNGASAATPAPAHNGNGSHGEAGTMRAVAAEQVVGCVSLLRYNSGLVEVRSLAVHPDARGQGLGRQLMQALLQEARRRDVPTLFALTRAVGFFQALGFAATDRHRFPEKVWQDCRLCPLFYACDETAMVYSLADAGAGGAHPVNGQGKHHHSEVAFIKVVNKEEK